MGTPTFKSAQRELNKLIKNQPYAVKQLCDAPGKKIEKLLRQGFDPAYFMQHPLPADQAWSKMVNGKEIFMAKAPHFHIGLTSFASTEIRFVLEGNLAVMGIPLSSVPGADIREKRTFVFGCKGPDLAALVKSKSGFVAEVGAGHACVIPNGFLVAMCYTDVTIGLRWLLKCDNAEKLRTQAGMEELIQNFPELRSPGSGYTQFLQYLQAT